MTTFSVEVPSLRVSVATPGAAPLSAVLGVAPLVLGTSADADVVVADTKVSRRHCELRLTDQGVVLRDLQSKNGVFIGVVRVHEAILALDTPATIGSSTVTVRADGPAAKLPLSPAARFGEAVGGSIAMRLLFAQLDRVAQTHETVLLIGESGTGKEILARAIHDHSPRRAGAYVVFDCSAAAPNLIEDQLFGHVRGAFTGAEDTRPGVFEQAHGGTLFLDEIGELPLELQPKLLRALESRTIVKLGDSTRRAVDCRVIAATHRNLRALVQEGRFRQDLYYRLQVVERRVPPLRERREDIPILVERFLAAHTPPRSLADLPPNAVAMLESHAFPGNVRELRNTVARLVLFADLGDVTGDAADTFTDDGLGRLADLPLKDARDVVVERFEKSFVEAKLKRAGGVVVEAAASMGVSRQMVYKLMDRYGIPRGGERDK
ncbi:MAG: sigma 54-interacting transcriptional regulator [Polyangiaceae bacterium]